MSTVQYSSEVQQELASLKKNMNDFLKIELAYILKPEYVSKDSKARDLVDILIKLSGPVGQILENPQMIHHTALDDVLKEQKLVVNQLQKDFPEALNSLKQVTANLAAVSQALNDLRRDVPAEQPAPTAKMEKS